MASLISLKALCHILYFTTADCCSLLNIFQHEPQKKPHVSLIISPLRALINAQSRRWGRLGMPVAIISPLQEILEEDRKGKLYLLLTLNAFPWGPVINCN